MASGYSHIVVGVRPRAPTVHLQSPVANGESYGFLVFHLLRLREQLAETQI